MSVALNRDWTDKRIDDFRDRVDQRFDEVDRRFDEVVRRFDDVDRRFEAVDRRFDKVDTRFDKFAGEVKAGFEKVEAAAKQRSASSDAAIAALGEKLDETRRWLMGGLGTIVAAVILK